MTPRAKAFRALASRLGMPDLEVKRNRSELSCTKKQLAEELQVQLPSITRLTLAKGTALEQNMVMSEEQVVVVAHCSEMPSEEEKTRVYEWLKVRLQVTNLEIIFDQEAGAENTINAE